MPKYVDGYVLPVPKKNLPAYFRMASKAAAVWRDHGALEYHESVGEDLAPAFGAPYTRVFKCKPGETVVFSWIVFKSRAHRDAVNARVMNDPRLAAMMGTKKMVHPGFAGMEPGKAARILRKK